MSEEYGKCVPILSHFVKKNVVNAKYASRLLQSSHKRAQSTEHTLITMYDAAEVLITPLELRARSIWSWSRLKTGSQSSDQAGWPRICYIFSWKIIKKPSKTWIFGFSRMRLPLPRAAQSELRDATCRVWARGMIRKWKMKTFREFSFFSMKIAFSKNSKNRKIEKFEK